MTNWDQTYDDLKRRGWIILLILSSAGYFFLSPSFTLGIILGGIIIFLNFRFLQSTIIKTFQQNPAVKKNKALLIIKSFLRLFILGSVIFILIKYDLADPIGLAIGLSIIFLSIVSLGIGSFRKNATRRVF